MNILSYIKIGILWTPSKKKLIQDLDLNLHLLIEIKSSFEKLLTTLYVNL